MVAAREHPDTSATGDAGNVLPVAIAEPSPEGATGALTVAADFDRVSASMLPPGGAAATGISKALADFDRVFASMFPSGGAAATMLANAERTFAAIAPPSGFKALAGLEALAEYDYSVLADTDGLGGEAADSVDAPYIKRVRTLSNRELAIWLTLITCLLLNISLVALKHSPRLAYIMTEEGVNPFDGLCRSVRSHRCHPGLPAMRR